MTHHASAVTARDAHSAGCPAHRLTLLAHAGRPERDEVQDFFEQYREHTGMPLEAWMRRLKEVETELERRGTYTHTTEELTVGAKLAWYHHTRCIGKLY